jgi:hypothetical protein
MPTCIERHLLHLHTPIRATEKSSPINYEFSLSVHESYREDTVLDLPGQHNYYILLIFSPGVSSHCY